MRVGFDKKHQQYDKMQGKPQHRGDPREPSDFLNALCPRSYAYGFIQREGSSKQGQDCSLPHRAGQAGPGGTLAQWLEPLLEGAGTQEVAHRMGAGE